MNLNTNLSLQQLSRMLSVSPLPLEDEAVLWNGAPKGVRARASMSRENHRFQFVVYDDAWDNPVIELSLRERGGFVVASPEEAESLLQFIEAISGLVIVE